jgi:hypothetical protein
VSDERVIAYLRTRAQVEPEPQLVERIMAGVESAPHARSRFAALLPAAVVAAAVAIVAALAIIFGQNPNVGPNPAPSTEAAPSPASVEELRTALELGLDVLRRAPGVEGVGTSYVLGELHGATWFSWRPSGDQIVIARSDVDVSETAWWLEPGGAPPARGENVTTTIHVLAGDEYFTADADAWSVLPRADAPTALTVATGLLDGESMMMAAFTGYPDGDVTIARNRDGSTTWSLTAPHRDGTAVSEWQIAADAALSSWTLELIGVTPSLEDSPFATFQQLDFRRLPTAGPIDAPDTESPPDPMALGLPPDFPLEAP